MDLRSHSVSRRGCKMWKATVIAAFLLSWFRLGSGVEVCPSESFNLTCTVTDSIGLGATVWKGDSSVFVCASGNIQLLHTVSMAIGDCEPLAVGRIVSADDNNFTSVLTVTAPMNGSLLPVQCTFPQPLPNPPVVVMEYNVNVTGPPTFVPDNLTVSEIMPVSVSGVQWEFNLEWEVPPEYCDLDYVFTPLQPTGQCTTTCTTECRRFRAGPGPRNFTVTAQNCGKTQNGTESEPLLVCLELPAAPEVCPSLTYLGEGNGQLSESLQTIHLTWDPVPDPKDPFVDVASNTPIVGGDVTGYQVTVIGMETKYLNSSTTWYTADVSENVQDEHTVSIAAENILGVGNPASLGPYSRMNNFIEISLDDNCTFVVDCNPSNFTFINVTLDPGFSHTMVPCNSPFSIMLNRTNTSMTYDYTVEASDGCLTVVIRGEAECTTTTPTEEPSPRPSEDEDLSDGAIIGIIVGVIAGVSYCAGVAAAGGMAWYIRPAVSCLVIFLLIWLSWIYFIYFIYLLCAGKKKHHSKGATQKSVETQMDDEVKSTEPVQMADTYEMVPSGPPAAVKTRVMGVESTPPQQTEAKSEEEPKAAKKKGFFKNRSGKKAAEKESDEVELQSQEPLEPAETGALYQDPGEIKREEYPGTHDFYAQPDIKRKTHKPEDHLPTYGDPRDIKHVEAPETGELYAVTKQPSKKRAAPPPPEGATGYTSVDIEKKHRAKELNYSELQMPPGGPAPPSQHVEYSNVVQL